ncbi:hypothetical protein D3C71_1146460 [compost metagenome]
MILRVAAEIREADKLRILLALRHFEDFIRFPERFKRRECHALRLAALSGNLIKSLQPVEIGFTFSEPLATALFPALTQIRKHLKIVTRLIARWDHTLHRHHMLVTVVAGHGQIVTLKRRRCRQNDIGMFGRRGPEAFGDNYQLRLLPGAD